MAQSNLLGLRILLFRKTAQQGPALQREKLRCYKQVKGPPAEGLNHLEPTSAARAGIPERLGSAGTVRPEPAHGLSVRLRPPHSTEAWGRLDAYTTGRGSKPRVCRSKEGSFWPFACSLGSPRASGPPPCSGEKPPRVKGRRQVPPLLIGEVPENSQPACTPRLHLQRHPSTRNAPAVCLPPLWWISSRKGSSCWGSVGEKPNTVSARMQVRSPASLRGLRIPRCHKRRHKPVATLIQLLNQELP